MTWTKTTRPVFLFGVGVLLVLMGTGCAKKQIESQPTDLGVQAPQEVTRTTTAKAAEQAAKEQELAEAEEYRLRQAEAEAAAAEKEAEERARKQQMEKIQELIYFAFDSYELSETAREVLKQKAGTLEDNPGFTLMIEGHCDERGTEEYNLALGERRARAAYEYLILLGLSPDRLSIISFGEEKPLDPGHTEQAWAKNRRAQFRIIETGM